MTDTPAEPKPRPSKPPMEDRIAAEQEANPLCHDWIVAAEVAVDMKTAKRADIRLSFKAEAGQRISALEVYCRRCRRPLDEVGDQACSAKINNEHLIGGDQSTRAKRKLPPPLAEGVQIIKPPSIQRRGIDAYINGVT